MNTTYHATYNVDFQPFPNLAPAFLRFVRRSELTESIRTNIAIQAYEAQQNKNWGVITKLSRQYQVSRTFIYEQVSLLIQATNYLFVPEKPSKINIIENASKSILSYRMEGKSSVGGISTLLKRENSPYSSIGYISQYLTRIGESLPNTLINYAPTTKALTFVYDEVFSKSQPILITVDPISSVILSIQLADQVTSEQWKDHFQNINDHGFYPNFLCSDGGTALCAAQSEMFSNIPWQLDTFHGIAHRLGEWNRRLEKLAYNAIKVEYKCERLLNSAKSDAVIERRSIKYSNAVETSTQAIELYDSFKYLYHYLIQQLNIFNANGDLRQRDEVRPNMETALELMELLQHEEINKEVCSIKVNLPDLLTYFSTAKKAIENCKKLSSNQDALRALYLAWQWNKASVKSKKTERKHKAIEQRDQHLELAALFINDKQKFLKLKSDIFNELNEIVQASSMVECINSILRPYLNSSKNQVNQEFLNLFMFYHNHRRYRAGKRKGKTPMEILTDQKQEDDWITLLQTEVRSKEPA